jgi:hypothetical protein
MHLSLYFIVLISADTFLVATFITALVSAASKFSTEKTKANLRDLVVSVRQADTKSTKQNLRTKEINVIREAKKMLVCLYCLDVGISHICQGQYSADNLTDVVRICGAITCIQHVKRNPCKCCCSSRIERMVGI